MKVHVEMGQEEFLAFLKFQEERPKLITEIRQLKSELRELAEEVDWAVTEEDGEIRVNQKIAKDLLRIAGKHL